VGHLAQQWPSEEIRDRRRKALAARWLPPGGTADATAQERRKIARREVAHRHKQRSQPRDAVEADETGGRGVFDVDIPDLSFL
jgi:hypothetical protein